MHNFTFYIAYNDELKEQCNEVRKKVFIDEFNISNDIIFDDKDKFAVHFLIMKDDTPLATARMFVNETNSVLVSAVAVVKEYRGKGIGKMLIDRIINYCRKNGTQKINLESMVEVVGFYEKLGFEKVGSEFIKANIPHFMMELNLAE